MVQVQQPSSMGPLHCWMPCTPAPTTSSQVNVWIDELFCIAGNCKVDCTYSTPVGRSVYSYSGHLILISVSWARPNQNSLRAVVDKLHNRSLCYMISHCRGSTKPSILGSGMAKFMQFLVKLREYESCKDFIPGDSVGTMQYNGYHYHFLANQIVGELARGT